MVMIDMEQFTISNLLFLYSYEAFVLRRSFSTHHK